MPIPDSDHNEELSPDVLSGVLLNYQWRAIIAPILDRELSRLAPDDTDFEKRINALLEDIYSVDVVYQKEIYQLYVERVTSTQSLLAANSPNAIIWNGGSFDISNPTRFPCPDDGHYVISANFRLACVNAIGWEVRLRKNGTDELMRVNHAANTLWQIGFTYQFHAFSGDYIELLIAHSQNATLHVTTPNTKALMLVMPE